MCICAMSVRDECYPPVICRVEYEQQMIGPCIFLLLTVSLRRSSPRSCLDVAAFQLGGLALYFRIGHVYTRVAVGILDAGPG